ncbi:MAG: TonB-dependent receptor [Pseudomonadota bacterium]
MRELITRGRSGVLYYAFVLSALIPLHALAQQGATDPDEDRPEEIAATRSVGAGVSGNQDQIVVTATRRPQKINEIARSVVVVGPELIGENRAKSSNIFDLIGAAVPSLGPPSQNDISRGQTLRGRDPQYLIDGVPLGFNGGSGAGAGELAKFDPEILGRIEVLYGPNAVYGAGATGGVIQFFTKEASEEPFEIRLRQQFSTFLNADNIFSNTARSNKTTVAASGTLGKFDYLLNYSFDSVNGIIDAEGDVQNRVFYGFEDEASYFAKIGFDITENQRIEGFYNFVDQEPDPRVFDSVITDDGRAISVVSASAAPFTYGPDNQPLNEKKAWNVRYSIDELFGGAFSVQYYGRDEDRVTELIDLRANNFAPPFPDNYQALFLDRGEGVRTQYSTTIFDRIGILLGFDYDESERRSDALVFELGPDFDDDRNVINPIREDTFLFPVELEQWGIFAQVDIEVTEDLRLSGGVRFEDVSFEIGSGTRVFEVVTNPDGSQISRQGGSGENDGIAWNVGVSYDATDWLNVYANFAQGFEIPSLTSLGFRVPPDQPLTASAAVEPQVVDNYEIGLRGAVGVWDYSLAGYFSQSELGATFIIPPGSFMGGFARAPQENYGFEAVVGVNPIENLRLSGALSWNDGDFDIDDDGDFDPLPGLEAPGLKFVFNANYDVNEDLSLNGQILTVGDRNRAFDAGIDPAPVDGYTVVDIGALYAIGPGALSFQLTNLLNTNYITAANQTFVGTGFVDRVVGAAGRQVILAYEVTF